MTTLAVAPDPEGIEDTQLELFEGLRVQRYRLAPGSIPEFTSTDQEGNALKLTEGDLVVIQTEVLITSVEVGAGYKGSIQTKARDRVHHGKVIDGSQVVVHVERRS